MKTEVLFSAVSLYAPAIALSAVTSLPLWLAITSVGVVCTFYCTFGGIKAVLWTDVFQAILMFVGILVIIVRGCMDVGGFSNVFKIANIGGRLTVPSLTIDISERYTMLSVLIQGLVITLASYGCSQVQVQRLLTVKNFRHSVAAAVFSIPMISGFQLACCLCGLIFYAVYRFCDPLSSAEKPLHSADQLMPYYITNALKDLPGLPGLCIAGIFSASLSTVSSSVNAMAAVIVEDFIRPIRPKYASSVLLSKFLTFFFGVLCVLLSFMGGVLGHLVKTTVLVVGLFYGVTLAIYLLASLSTVTNEKGAIFGVLVGTCFGVYLSVISSQTVHEILPMSNECPLQNQTHNLDTASSLSEPSMTEYTLNSTLPSFNSSIFEMKTSTNTLSYMWITPISFVVSLTTGYVSSLIFALIQDEPQDVPTIHLSPIRRRFCKDKMKVEAEQKINQQTTELNEITAKITNA
ncbi:putative sodium-dependent multivitamin transporter isoform X2 [Uloborus diversus]|uniref:putative sodium-dependent multivitamin transporter isoform X2 n=1 Tax=Uloborus diversus TaxID=327109 RepID=UPI0024096FA9|nr:putative sodium-dependent multivitamin transporter isoform X2 [Uloborus diversus]